MKASKTDGIVITLVEYIGPCFWEVPGTAICMLSTGFIAVILGFMGASSGEWQLQSIAHEAGISKEFFSHYWHSLLWNPKPASSLAVGWPMTWGSLLLGVPENIWCNYLSMYYYKLDHNSKWGPRSISCSHNSPEISNHKKIHSILVNIPLWFCNNGQNQ